MPSLNLKDALVVVSIRLRSAVVACSHGETVGDKIGKAEHRMTFAGRLAPTTA